MARFVSPLAVAAVAALLLVATLAFDANFNRSYHLELEQNGQWRTLGSAGETGSRDWAHPRPLAPVAVNETMDLRLRMDNGYPWAASKEYQVMQNGQEVARGSLHAEARTEVVHEFTLTPSEPTRPDPADGHYVFIEVRIGGQTIFTDVFVKEGSA